MRPCADPRGRFAIGVQEKSPAKRGKAPVRRENVKNKNAPYRGDQKKKKASDMKYSGVIFDLDGVICSTDRFHYLAWKHIADKMGIPFDETVNSRLRGVSRMDSLEIILERYDGALTDAQKEALAAEKNELYRSYLADMSPRDLSDEVKRTLLALRAARLKLAIGSSSKNTKFILERLGLGVFFDAVSDGTNITRSKPDPQVFLMAAEFISLPPERCLVVEDARSGIEAAIAGGFDSAGLGEAAACGKATYPLTAFEELVRICGA